MSFTSAFTRAEVAALVDHTFLSAEATRVNAHAATAEAIALGTKTICLSPSMFPINTGPVLSCAVAGFPTGKHHSLVKAAEARLAVDSGAQEIAMVIDLGAALAGMLDEVFADVLTVRGAIGPEITLKVIIESAALLTSAGAQRVSEVSGEVAKAGATIIETSTGFHPAGGATTQAIKLIKTAIPGGVGIKASGHVDTAEVAAELLVAGATRLGLTHTALVLDGFAT